jgi:hypothetical protein
MDFKMATSDMNSKASEVSKKIKMGNSQMDTKVKHTTLGTNNKFSKIISQNIFGSMEFVFSQNERQTDTIRCS